jgi:hypothetical protein
MTSTSGNLVEYEFSDVDFNQKFSTATYGRAVLSEGMNATTEYIESHNVGSLYDVLQMTALHRAVIMVEDKL